MVRRHQVTCFVLISALLVGCGSDAAPPIIPDSSVGNSEGGTTQEGGTILPDAQLTDRAVTPSLDARTDVSAPGVDARADVQTTADVRPTTDAPADAGNRCAPNPCMNGGTCAPNATGYVCTCPAGYSGSRCETNINDCSPNPCANGGTCTDAVDSFTCACAPGYSGATCATNVDDCSPNPCENGGTCTDGVNGFTCACPTGFTGNRCDGNTDDCASSPCQNGGTCTDGANGYTCACAPGYSGADCQININECAGDPCANGGTCTDGVNGFTCVCAPGYSGTTCATNIDECLPAPCANGGTCTDGVNSFTCTCAPGYTGTTCETNIDDCAESPCLNGGTCADGVNSFSCTCAPGYSGTTCATDIDECEISPCQNGGACTDGVNSRTCVCVPGYTGDSCETNIDECTLAPCMNGGTCMDGVNMRTCVCAPGYMGPSCEVDIDECVTMPCQNGGTCTDGVNMRTCTCPPQWMGASCETAVLCGNGDLDASEGCDDGNFVSGDGCTSCAIDANYYCYGSSPSICRFGSCVSSPLTTTPTGFSLDGAATYSAAGLRPSVRSQLRTIDDVNYPVLIETDIRWSGSDIAFVGTRGTGLRDNAKGPDEPTDSVWARIHNFAAWQTDLATGPGISVFTTNTAAFLTTGVTYKIRYVDDGFAVRIEIWNPANTSQTMTLTGRTQYVGGGHRAFIGGANGMTYSNLRVCSAPALPVTSGLAARYTARNSWTNVQDGANNTGTWNDISGNGRNLTRGTQVGPVFSQGLLAGNPTMVFSGTQRMTTPAPFMLNSEVTVFAVTQHRNPNSWGNIAHHGNRDLDWSLETNGGSPTTMHWQSSNDNSGVQFDVVPYSNYVFSGRILSTTRSFIATDSSGSQQTASANGVSIASGVKTLYVGASDILEQSNAYISELVYYDRPLDDTERAAVTDYLRRMWIGRGPTFVEAFQPVSGTAAVQCTTGNTGYSSATVPYWTSSGGTNPVHAVQVTRGDFAATFYDGNIITQNSLVGANANGVTYTVAFHAGPSVQANCAQATQAGDALRIEVVRQSGTVLATNNHAPAAWAGAETLTRGSFTYVGDGSGPIRLRITDPLSNNRFAGGIDNITIQPQHP